MAKPEIVVEKGTVESFDRDNARGRVKVGKKMWTFDSTSFFSGRPVRFPVPGEAVEVVLGPSREVLLGVRPSKS